MVLCRSINRSSQIKLCSIFNHNIFKMKTYKLVFEQSDKTCEVAITTNNTDIDEIAGTLANKVINFISLARKYKAKIGFNFSRKFDVKLIFDGIELDTLNNIVISGENVQFKLTIVNNEKSFLKFATFMKDFVTDAVTTLGVDEEVSINELISDLSEN